MKQLFTRTNYCGALRAEDEGREVVLNGWVQKKRNLGSLIFVDLRDRTGIVQLAFGEWTKPDVLAAAERLKSEFVVGVKGKVAKRENANAELKTGEVEVVVSEIMIYSEAETPPIYVQDGDNASEDLRLKYRFLDLRKPAMQKRLRFRHELLQETRRFFSGEGFLEIDTPILIKPTPEGARDYLVPSRANAGKFYALPQSPQMFKQLLMCAGADRYFQVAKCFRDEDLRADRQPEFTQIDLEMSFAGEEQVLAVQEAYLKTIFAKLLDREIKMPFPRLTYREAMARFGSDRPDTRFGFELEDITEDVKDSSFKVFASAAESGELVCGINFAGLAEKYSRKNIDKLAEEIKTFGAQGLLWFKISGGELSSSFAKFLAEGEVAKIKARFSAKDGDMILLVRGKEKIVYASLGFLREKLAKDERVVSEDELAFLWVTDFPMFEEGEDGKLKALHHPFTSPDTSDAERIKTEPLSLLSRSYDIVLNGVELGGGSIRIHDSKIQEAVFEALGMGEAEVREKFGFLIDAFRYGVPPHGGLAYGLDRLLAAMLGDDSIREVIAFPKNQQAVCPVSGAPAEAAPEALSELGLLARESGEEDGGGSGQIGE